MIRSHVMARHRSGPRYLAGPSDLIATTGWTSGDETSARTDCAAGSAMERSGENDGSGRVVSRPRRQHANHGGLVGSKMCYSRYASEFTDHMSGYSVGGRDDRHVVDGRVVDHRVGDPVLSLRVTLMPSLIAGGAPMTTAGGQPMNAGTMSPGPRAGRRRNEYAFGPRGGGPAMTPGRMHRKRDAQAGSRRDELHSGPRPEAPDEDDVTAPVIIVRLLPLIAGVRRRRPAAMYPHPTAVPTPVSAGPDVNGLRWWWRRLDQHRRRRPIGLDGLRLRVRLILIDADYRLRFGRRVSLIGLFVSSLVAFGGCSARRRDLRARWRPGLRAAGGGGVCELQAQSASVAISNESTVFTYEVLRAECELSR